MVLPDAPSLEALLPRLPAMLQPLAAQGELRCFTKDTVIIEEGTPGAEVFFLLQGSVLAYSTDAHERGISFAIDRVGEYFGEMALDGGPRSASVVALEDAACAVVSCSQVWHHVGRDPAFARALIERLIGRSRFTTDRARELVMLDVYGRLRLLLENRAPAPNAAGERPIAGRLTHREIARQVGSSREMVSRLMKDLEKGGYIRTGRASVTLLKALPKSW